MAVYKQAQPVIPLPGPRANAISVALARSVTVAASPPVIRGVHKAIKGVCSVFMKAAYCRLDGWKNRCISRGFCGGFRCV